MNEIILLCETIIIFSIVVLFKKIFGKYGIITWVSIATILANILTAKNVNLFNMSATLGTALFASTFLATDILTECYSKQDAKIAINIGVCSSIILILMTQIALLYKPNEFDYVNNSMQTLFSLNLRISLSSIIMYYIANTVDIYLFAKIKEKTNNTKLWLRNNVSTILCNCIENFGFIAIAFIGIYDIKTIIIMACSTSIIEIIIAILDTPFIYLSKKISDC